MAKQLRLSKNKLFLGVVAGFAEYFDIDITLLRVLFALFIVFTGFFPGVFFYFVAWLIMSAHNSDVVDTTAKKK